MSLEAKERESVELVDSRPQIVQETSENNVKKNSNSNPNKTPNASSNSYSVAKSLRNVSVLSIINAIIVFIVSISFRVKVENESQSNKECCVLDDRFDIHLISHCLLTLILLCLPNFGLFIYNIYDLYKNWYPVLKPINLTRHLTFDRKTKKHDFDQISYDSDPELGPNEHDDKMESQRLRNSNINTTNNNSNVDSTDNNDKSNNNNNNNEKDHVNIEIISKRVECESAMYQLIYGIIMVIMATLWAVIWTEVDAPSFNDQICCHFVSNSLVLDWSVTLFMIDTCLSVYYIIAALTIVLRPKINNTNQ